MKNDRSFNKCYPSVGWDDEYNDDDSTTSLQIEEELPYFETKLEQGI